MRRRRRGRRPRRRRGRWRRRSPSAARRPPAAGAPPPVSAAPSGREGAGGGGESRVGHIGRTHVPGMSHPSHTACGQVPLPPPLCRRSSGALRSSGAPIAAALMGQDRAGHVEREEGAGEAVGGRGQLGGAINGRPPLYHLRRGPTGGGGGGQRGREGGWRRRCSLPMGSPFPPWPAALTASRARASPAAAASRARCASAAARSASAAFPRASWGRGMHGCGAPASRGILAVERRPRLHPPPPHAVYTPLPPPLPQPSADFGS